MSRSRIPRLWVPALLQNVLLAAMAACAQQPVSDQIGPDAAQAPAASASSATPAQSADRSQAQPTDLQQPEDSSEQPSARAPAQAGAAEASASLAAAQKLPTAFVCVPADDWSKAKLKTAHKSSAQVAAAPPAAAPSEAQTPPRPESPALISVLGKKVVGRDGEDLGHVVDVLADSEGQTRAAIIDFGGFLGVGNRRVAVDWRSLQIDSASLGKPVVLSLSRDQVKAAPEFKELDLAHPPIVANPTASAPAQSR